jgi:hypothetical protein
MKQPGDLKETHKQRGAIVLYTLEEEEEVAPLSFDFQAIYISER